MPRQTDLTTPVAPDNQSLTALAYSATGKFLGRGKVKDGIADFGGGVESAALKRARIFVLPEPEGGLAFEKMSLEQVESLETFEPRLDFTDRGHLNLSPIPDRLAPIWLWKKCRVRGRISNRTTVSGSLQTFPVCSATVHICEVDRIRYWFERIPLDILNRLRFGLKDRLEPVKKPFIPRLDRLDVADLRRVETTAALRNRPEIALLERPAIRTAREATTNRLSVDARLSEAAFNASKIKEISATLERLPDNDLRELLINEYVFFRPYFCFFPFLWPYLYRCEEVAVARTDRNGRYEACFYHQETAPDVYIWVTYDLPEGETTVYRPPVVCYTRWEYDCSSDIDVQLNDSRIQPTCGTPLTGLTCAIRSIGTSVSPLEIEQDLAATIPVPGVTNDLEMLRA